MKLKKLIALSALSTTLLVPTVVTSCSTTSFGDISKEDQSNLLNSDASKIAVFDSWLSSTYTLVYAQQTWANDSSDIQQNKAYYLQYYLKHLDWPTNDDWNNDEEFKGKTLEKIKDNEKEAFENSLKNAYKFYISFNSKISVSSDSSSPSTYFILKALEWKKAEYGTICDLGDQIKINNFNPGINYTGLDKSGNIIENDFKILMSTRGTKVFQEVLKLLLSEMYFMHTTETQIRNGTNHNKMTKNPSSLNSINTEAYVGENNDFSDYLLKKYLVENTVNFKWSYSKEDYTATNTTPGRISTLSEFNNLKITKEQKLEDLAPSIDNLGELEAFNSLEINVSSSDEENVSNTGDMANTIEEIKLFGTEKLGLLDKDKNVLFSFSEFEAIKAIIEYNNTATADQKLSLPSININEEGLKKRDDQIDVNDLVVSWDGTTNSLSPISGTEKKFSGEFDGKNGQKLKINTISFDPDTSVNKLTISFTYTWNNYSFNYDFAISNWGNNEEGIINPFNTPIIFEGTNIGVSIFDGNEPLGVSYYLRVLPIFEREKTISISKKWYSKGKFTFKGTNWETEDEKRKLVYFMSLSNTNLFTSVQDFYLFNNYDVVGEVSELKSIISSLGLNKKTDSDRRDQGIK